jgi:cytochrome c556
MVGRWSALAASAALAVAITTGAVASHAQDKEAVIKERQALMKRQAANLKAIGAYAKGQGDQATALAKANDMLTLSPKIAALFPPGTSLADFPGKTEAKPEIWQNMDKFKALPATLHSEEEKLLAAVKSGDRQAVAAQIGATGKNACGACHNSFRQKKS